MALTTYAELQTAIGTRLSRTDQAAFAVDYITLTEAAMNRRLRVRRMIQRDTAVVSSEYSAVPTSFLGVKAFQITDSPVTKLLFLTPDQMDGVEASTGTPRYYSIVGGEFRFWPSPSASVNVELQYWKAIPALSVSNTSNWVLAYHPDAYLYGALLQAALQIRDEGLTATYGQLFETAIADIERADRAESDGAPTPTPNGYAW